ncbi:MAG: bifunctional 5,10-methylenetetrahydrofolate dehydrogenase/5,10-methenyltetrahydrofolate cyclohydrolase [Candidatus Paceibacterota bacterium]
MILLDGKKISEKILNDLKKTIEKRGLGLKLAIVIVGNDMPSKVFIKKKEEACKKIGIDFELYEFDKDIKVDRLREEVEKICKKSEISGVVIQLPLPLELRAFDQQILNLVPPSKDIDILSEKNLGCFYSGFLPVMPPVVSAVFCLLNEYEISLKGKNIVIIGAGRLVGLPLAVSLLKKKATVSVLNEFTDDFSGFLKKADIIISGVGKPGIIKGEDLKNEVIVIDAGTSFKEGKTVGDVDIESVSKKAKYIAPVPGGVGPLTIAFLLENLVRINLE